MNEELSIELFGDLDLEGMAINVCYKRETIASINYEKGIANLEVEILPIHDKLSFTLESFLSALEKAKKLAIKCAKEDEELRKKGIDF